MNYIEFPNLFNGVKLEVGRVAFPVFGIDVYWYGIVVATAIILAFLYAMKRAPDFGMISDRVFDAAAAGLIGGFLCARLYFVIFSETSYNFITFFTEIRDGGLAIYGGVIGGVIVSFAFMKWRKIQILPVLDLAGMSFLIGIGLGRWGNFFNQEAYGAAVNPEYFLGMTGERIVREMGESLVHPCFLYESMWCALGFILLHFYSKKLRTFDGEIFLLFTAWYGTGRAFNEQLRTDSLMLGEVKISQILAIVSAVMAIGAFAYLKFKVKKADNYKMYVSTEESAAEIAAYEEKLRLEKEKAAAVKALKKEGEKAPSILGEDAEEDDEPNLEPEPKEVTEEEPDPDPDEENEEE